MGPTALFDKSFLQSLSVDESVWFDHFFLPNVCPIFYVETLADLAKENCGSRTPDDTVRIIASKFPDCSGAPNVYHVTICTANLLGEEIPLSPQVILPAGCQGTVDGRNVVVLPERPESKAWLRWTQGDFQEVERIAARQWRGATIGYESGKVIRYLEKYDAYQDKPCGTLSDVSKMTDEVFQRLGPVPKLTLALSLLGVPPDQHDAIQERWFKEGVPELSQFAPYVAFTLRVEIFFHIAVYKARIGAASRMDSTYLFYLPFCQFFVSTDWVHRDSAPFFLRADQQFIWGADLKAALKSLNDLYAALPEDERSKSIYEIASTPPTDIKNLVTDLWDRHWPTWRTPRERQTKDTENGIEWLQHQLKVMKAIAESEGAKQSPDQIPDAICRPRTVRTKKGSWWHVPDSLRKRKQSDDPKQ